MLDGPENLVLGLHDIVEFQRHSRRKLLEYLDHHLVRGADAAVQGLAAIGRVESMAVRKCGADALQDSLRVERPRNCIGGAQRPGLHRSMMERVGNNEQTRHRTINFGLQLVANLLHTLGRSQIDIDHDPRKVAGRRGGDIRRRNGIDHAHGLQNAGQFAALIAAVRRQKQPAFG